jgi:hypothetical protein
VKLRSHVAALVGLVLVAAGTVVPAQSLGGLFGRREALEFPRVPYDGRFTFARLRYPSGFQRNPPWFHDYPTADIHLSRILQEVTAIEPRVDGSNVLSLEDPDLMKYPIAYMSEPGYWTLDEEQASAFRAYLLKGGFAIFDDFRGPDLYNFESQLRRVLPDLRLVELEPGHPVFHSFFEIDSPEEFIPPYGGLLPKFLGVFEDNDPQKRLLLVANYNNDLGEYWEFSDTGYAPVDLSNEAYKFGTNYIVYGLTH